MQREEAVVFECEGSELVGVLHRPVDPASNIGVVVVVGGPQYRVGSHRQFVHLGRALASAGITCLRFDHRGIGDSGGAFAGFEAIGADIRAAVDHLLRSAPSLRGVALWGLCDAASAILMYAWQDERVRGVSLVNPWARSPAGAADALVRHYYGRRIFSRELWRKLATGQLDIRGAVRGFFANARLARGAAAAAPAGSFRDRMLAGAEKLRRPALLVISGDDLTAAEFVTLADGSPRWRAVLARPAVTRCDLPEANHTFSRDEWRRQVEEWTVSLVRACAAS